MVTMSAVWDRTSGFLSDNLPAVAAIALPTLYLPGVVSSIVNPLTATATPMLKLGLGVLSLAVSLLTVLAQIALVALTLDPQAGPGAAFARGGPRFPAMIGISLLLLLLLFLLCLPLVLIAAAGGLDLANLSATTVPNLAPGSALLMVLYVLILLPVVIWLGARLAPLGAVVVGERRGIGAIRHAFGLTRGLGGRIVGVMILFMVVAFVAGLAAQTVFGSIFRLAFGNVGAVNTASILTALVTALVSAASTVILTAFSAQLYLAVRDRADMVPATA